MIDIHSHVLPGIDDGSRSTEMSLKMLEITREQGIDTLFLTPHFYADAMDPETFLGKRKEAEEKLKEAVGQAAMDVPEWILGSEVHYYRGIGRSEDIDRLCMGESRFLLLEPPFRAWSESFLEDVRVLRDELDRKVIIAHIERYLDQDKRLVQELLEEPGIFIQCNAEFFLDRHTRRKALKMLKEGRIHFLGSDCHNLTGRCPNLGYAVSLIEEKLGEEALSSIEENNLRLVSEAASSEGR